MYFSLAAGGCALDLASKSWIFARLGYPTLSQKVIWLWPGILSLETSLNEGALFGIGQGYVAGFAILSVLAAAGILAWLFLFRAAHDRLLTGALGCVTAGVLGNLYDRLGLPGLGWPYTNPRHVAGDPVFAVRDWIHFQCPLFDWPIFNIADSLLVCGAGLLLWHAMRRDAPRAAVVPAAAQATEAKTAEAK